MKNILLYDGECGFCSAVADWVVRTNKDNNIETIPYQTADFNNIAVGLTFEQASRSAIFIRRSDGHIFLNARSILETLKHTHGIYELIGYLGSNPIISLLCYPFYRLFARYRRRLSIVLGYNACKIPENY